MTTGDAARRPTVLVADDNRDVADAYAIQLAEEYDVRVAYDGNEALDAIDSDVDVVLLDRDMPSVRGDAVLAAIEDRGLDCRVAMVTGVTPDVDIVDMGFDDYLCKPISGDELRATVESLLYRSEYDEQLQRYFSLVSKQAVLTGEKADRDVRDREEYARLTGDLARIEEGLSDTLKHLSTREAFTAALIRRPSRGELNF